MRLVLKIVDIDKYSPEMQNPDITKPAGAGDVPEANYKMIAALGVKRGELQRNEIADFVKEHGMTGWAPTQGTYSFRRSLSWTSERRNPGWRDKARHDYR